MINPRKTRSVRPLSRLDLGTLPQQIEAIPEEVWARENEQKPNRFEVLDRTQHIVFKFVTGLDDWRQSYELPLWAEWRERLEPLLREAVLPYGYANGVFPRIMLARMRPGGVIHPHVDGAAAAGWPHKIHIPLTTNEQVVFYVEPNYHHLPVGQAFELNNSGVHSVKNGGETDRIHLIFEYYDADQAVGQP